MMIQSVWKNLTVLEKVESSSQLNTSGVTLNADLEPKTQINKREWEKCENKYSLIDEKSPLMSYQRKPTFHFSHFNLGCQSIKMFNCIIVMS